MSNAIWIDDDHYIVWEGRWQGENHYIMFVKNKMHRVRVKHGESSIAVAKKLLEELKNA